MRLFLRHLFYNQRSPVRRGFDRSKEKIDPTPSHNEIELFTFFIAAFGSTKTNYYHALRSESKSKD